MADYSGQKDAPVKEGDVLEVQIEGVGEKGDGIARVSGFVIFVPNTKAGKRVKIKMTRVLAKVGFGELIGEVEKKPQKSVEPEEAKEEKEPEEVFVESPEDSEDFGEELVEEDEEFN